MYRVWSSVSFFAFVLLAGAVSALLIANLAPETYLKLTLYPLLFNGVIGPHVADWTAALGPAALSYDPGDAVRVLTLRSFVNEALMALFFAFVGKEVWEALTLKGGELRGPRALVPIIGTFGGVAVPALLYLALTWALGTGAELAGGWAIPTATELAFAYIIGLWIFGPKHPALRFLLLVAMADDAFGFIILAIITPGAVAPLWLLLSLGAALLAYGLFNWLPRRLDRGDVLRRWQIWTRQRLSMLPYILAGAASWYGFLRAGLNPALGLLPILPCLPHADRPYGIFAEAEAHLHDPLNVAQHALRWPVVGILLLFGLVNCGFTASSFGAPTLPVAAALVLGKPLGIALFCWMALRLLGLSLPPGLRLADLPALGAAAGVSMTVSMTLANAAFADPALAEAARLGVLLSLVSGSVAFFLSKATGVSRR